jgi:hypothetical protein
MTGMVSADRDVSRYEPTIDGNLVVLRPAFDRHNGGAVNDPTVGIFRIIVGQGWAWAISLDGAGTPCRDVSRPVKP